MKTQDLAQTLQHNKILIKFMEEKINSLDIFTQAYLEAAFWTEQERLDEDQEGLTIHDLHFVEMEPRLRQFAETHSLTIPQ